MLCPVGLVWLSNEGDEYLLCSLTWMHAIPHFMPLMFSSGKLSKSSPKMSAFIVFI